MIHEFSKCDNQEVAEIYIIELRHDYVDGFEDVYQGEWESEENFAWHIYEKCYEHEMSEYARRCFNVEAFERISSSMITTIREVLHLPPSI